MENTALLLLILTNLLIVLLLGAFAFLIYRLLKQQQESKRSTDAAEPPASYHPAILERFKEAEKLKPRRADLFCPNHPDEPGESTCAICDRLYCRVCIKPFKTLHFCKEHLPLIMRHDWDEVLTLKTSTSDPEEGVKLYERKKELFLNEDLPTYIETHYKINVDQDYIETYLVLFAIKEQIQHARSRFSGID